MFTNSPTARKVIYGIAVASQIAAFFTRDLLPDGAALSDAFSDTANLLAAVAGVTALTNITPAATE